MTTSSQHTPGSWHVFNWHGKATIVQNEKGQAIADCDVNVYLIDEVKASNARLIAAAPDLLAQIEMIARCVKCSESENPDKSDHLPAIVDGLIEACRKLLAKL